MRPDLLHEGCILTCLLFRTIKGQTRDNPSLTRPEVNSGIIDVPLTSTFQSSDHHTDVSPQDLSKHWCISIPTAIKTLKNTTQRYLCSAILPLSRRYRVDRVFQRKTISGEWSTDTMYRRCKSLDGNQYAQVFANKNYFAKLYPMDSKGKAGDALQMFCKEFCLCILFKLNNVFSSLSSLSPGKEEGVVLLVVETLRTSVISSSKERIHLGNLTFFGSQGSSEVKIIFEHVSSSWLEGVKVVLNMMHPSVLSGIPNVRSSDMMDRGRNEVGSS